MTISRTSITLALVGFALTAQTTTAFATNESSYQVGYHQAIEFYGPYCADDPEIRGPGCPGNDSAIWTCYKGTTDDKFGTVTNSTACMDGYVNGFKHWSQQNTKDCVDIVTKCGGGGCAPSIYINRNKTAIKEAASSIIPQLVGTWNYFNKSSGVSGTMTFGLRTDDTNGPIMEFNQTIGDKTIGVNKWSHYTGSWAFWAPHLELHYGPAAGVKNITPTMLSPNHIQLQYPVKGYNFNPIVVDLTRDHQ